MDGIGWKSPVNEDPYPYSVLDQSVLFHIQIWPSLGCGSGSERSEWSNSPVPVYGLAVGAIVGRQ
jgi:hypothetical protein